MPKRIKNLSERLVAELEVMLVDEGGELTLRALAERADIAVGTIYNYFPTKDDLLKALFQKEWSAAVDEAERILRDAKSQALKPALLVKTVFLAGSKITGTIPKRRTFLHYSEGGREHKGPPYPFTIQCLQWLCKIFLPLWVLHFHLEEREADMLTVLLVSTMLRLQMLFPEAEDRNIQFLTEIVQERIEKYECE